MLLYLLPNHMDGSVVGKAWTDSMCGEYATGIISDHSDDAEAVAATASHEMGHNYGMSHDGAECNCNAGDNQCLMTAVIGWNPPTQWSSCSKTVLKQGLDEHKCMHDQPPRNLLYGEPQCGNGIQEEGEECDCGSKECDCCDYKTCKLLPGAECTPFDGVCCSDTCKIKSRGSLCREAVSECDVPEYCDGESLICPRNDFKHTGHQCAGGEGFCYGSHCKTKDGQCQSFFGRRSRSSPECKSKLNKGNELDRQCGNDYCVGGKKKAENDVYRWIGSFEYPIRVEDEDIKCKHIYSVQAKTVKFINVTLIDDAEEGQVQNGVPCSDDSFCIRGSCEAVRYELR